MAQTPLFTFPNIDPVAFSIGPIDIRWYAVSYMAGIILGWLFMRHQISSGRSVLSQVQLETLLNAAIFGIIIGGRLGYVFFYNPGLYLADPLAIIRVWEGGMSFHGGFIGVVLAVLLFARAHKVPLWAVSDRVALVAPLGLFFGRLANFINGELYGRVTSHPVGMVFPSGGPLPRHPSQLYEAGLEGLVLGFIMIMLWRMKIAQARPGILVSTFLMGYGLSRFIIEFAREPDSHLGLYDFGLWQASQGQLLSLPMVAIGFIFALIIIKKSPQNA